MENDQNQNYNNLENNSNQSSDKYVALVDHSILKKYSKLYFYLTALNAIFLFLYVIRWLFGLAFLNPTPDDILENILSKKIPYLNTINCTEDNTAKNPIFQNYPIKEIPAMLNYKRIPVDVQIGKICGYHLTASYAKNATFNHTCQQTVFFREEDCPTSYISGTPIGELMYDPNLVVNSKKEKFFVYKEKIIPKKSSCEFIEEIDPQYNSFLLPFLLLIPIGFCGLLQCVYGGICFSNKEKDDHSRPPISSTSYTSYEKVGEIHTYQGDRLVSKKDWKDNVRRVRNVYHQIPKTGTDYFIELWVVLASDAVVVAVCYYYGKMLFSFQRQVALVIRMGTEQCFENDYFNQRFQNYGDGIGAKALQMAIGVGLIGAFNAFCFLATFGFGLWKIGLKRLFCF